MEKKKLWDYLVTAIECMKQDLLCYDYTEEEALKTVLQDLNMSEEDYNTIMFNYI